MSRRPLGRSVFERPVLEVARDLLGRDVSCESPQGTVVVRLSEVEAYRGADDMGSHAYRGKTSRNEVMFGPAGFVYVYFTYGMHWCMNLVCQAEGEAAAVLLRAGRVIGGGEIAASRRGRSTERDLARGPARLCQALGIDGACNGADLLRGPVRVLPGVPVDDAVVRTGPRVGVARGAELPWRYYVDGDPTVSVYRPAVARKRRGTPATPDPSR
ncbi:MAG TPA: DNA-3-methyladenine glycosylase [Mycobacteriales bacterium]|nr:DNA-3-methyladenine glycosylase [Mycobacteriales bacterium]